MRTLRVQSFSAGAKRMLLLSRALEPDVVLSSLPAAQRAVLVALVLGATNAEIAALRSTSPRTVANQIAQLFQTLGVHSRYELAARFATCLLGSTT